MSKFADKFNECVKVLDKFGKWTGDVKSRDYVHRNKLLYASVGLLIINKKNKSIILEKRSPLKKHNPNRWAMIGGHVNSSDTFKKAIIREASEEIGIVLQGKKIKYLCTLKPHGNSHNFKHIYYMFDNVNLNNLNLQIEEVSDIKKIKYEPYYKAIKNGDRNYSGNWERYKIMFKKLKKILF